VVAAAEDLTVEVLVATPEVLVVVVVEALDTLEVDVDGARTPVVLELAPAHTKLGSV
jgi:hypothetical protein